MKGLELPRAMLWGTSGGMLLTAALAALLAALIDGGVLPAGSMTYAAWAIALLSGVSCGILAAARADRLRLPAALGAAAVYLLLALVLRGLIFGTVGKRAWLPALLLVLGSLIGGMTQAGKNTRKPVKSSGGARRRR